MHCYVFRLREVERGEENLNNNSANQKVPADNSGILRRWLHTLRRHLMMMLHSSLRFRVPSMYQVLPGQLVAGEEGEGGDRTLCCLCVHHRRQTLCTPLGAAAASAATRALGEEEPQKGGLVWSTRRFLWPTPSHSSDKRPRRETLSIYESKFHNWSIAIYFLSRQE